MDSFFMGHSVETNKGLRNKKYPGSYLKMLLFKITRVLTWKRYDVGDPFRFNVCFYVFETLKIS